MNYKMFVLSLLLMLAVPFSQSVAPGEIKPYPGSVPMVNQTITQPPLIPPMITTGIVIIIGIFVVLGMFAAFILIVLLMIKFIFPAKPLQEWEKLRKERVAMAKGWNGSTLDVVSLSGNRDEDIPPTVLGYCTGFKAEKAFDYVTYHTGLPGYLFLLRYLKGQKFQLYIPILDIMIPDDHIIQVEPTKRGALGKNLVIYATGVSVEVQGYESPNSTTVPVSSRMKAERSDIISRTHAKTASHIPEISEKLWEGGKEHFKKRDSEPSRAPAGK
jgi:hypothetical protein